MTDTASSGASQEFGDALGPDRSPAAPTGSSDRTAADGDASSGFGAGLTDGERSESGSGGRKRARRRRPAGRDASDDERADTAAAVADPSSGTPSKGSPSGGDDDDDEKPKRPRRRRGSRGGRGRKRSTPAASEDDGGSGGAADERAEAPSEPAEESERDGESERGRRGRRGGRSRRKKSATEERDADASEARDDAAEDASDDDGDGARRKRRRGSRGGRKRKKRSGAVDIEVIPGEEDDELAELPADAERVDADDDDDDDEASGKRGRKRSKKAKKRAKTSGSRKKEKDKDKPAEVDLPRDQVILVNAGDPEETRVAVAKDGKIVDLQMNVHRYQSYVNDIYRGRVVNLEEAIGAAFIDFGQGRNGFLHASDVMGAYGDKDWKLENLLTHQLPDEELADGKDLDIDEPSDEGGSGKKASKRKGRSGGRAGRRRSRPRLPIGDLLRKGTPVVVQVTKDAIGDKGPTLTTYISIPGRYLVLMPSLARTGVSRKIEDEKERRRLKRILQSLDIPEGMGVIVRTAGVSKTKTELSRDLEYLLAAWETFCKRLPVGRNPMPLYEESDVAIRTMRDLFSARTEKVVVDDPAVFERMVGFTNVLMPEHVDRIELHDGPRPLFHTYGVEQDFEKIFAHRVELPSGGSIVIDQTEALVAIDVNSGRTRDEGADFEDIALKTNLEAVPEIARQMRLRDLGGIIVLDFIDMARMASRRHVEKALREALASDRARSKIGRISQFGLLEMTRQRLGPGLSTLVYDTCSRCRGSGRQRTAQSRAQGILRRLGSALTLKGFSTVEVCAHPEVIDYLQHQCSAHLRDLREKSGRELNFKAVADQYEDSVLHYLRADGREVRPGGRRKR